MRMQVGVEVVGLNYRPDGCAIVELVQVGELDLSSTLVIPRHVAEDLSLGYRLALVLEGPDHA